MTKTSPQLSKIIDAAKAGGDILRSHFGHVIEIREKSSSADFQTLADIQSERAILNILVSEFASYNIYSEESGLINRNSEYTFIIDPLDGTNNYVLGLPNFTVSIGLIKNKEIISGVVYAPLLNNLYYAEKDKGAYFNGTLLNVNTEKDFSKASICYNTSYDTNYKIEIKMLDFLRSRNIKRAMSNWSVAFDLCMLASGKIEGIINYNSQLCDFSAGKLIAMEAGALKATLDGANEENEINTTFVMSSTMEVLNQLIEITKIL